MGEYPQALSFKNWGFFKVLSGVYGQSASEAIFRVRAYSYNLFSPVMIYLMNKTSRKPPTGDNPLLFSISGTGSFICPVTQTLLDIPRPLITQSWGTGGKAKCSGPRVGGEPTTHWLTSITLTHWANPTPLKIEGDGWNPHLNDAGWAGFFSMNICWIYAWFLTCNSISNLVMHHNPMLS